MSILSKLLDLVRGGPDVLPTSSSGPYRGARKPTLIPAVDALASLSITAPEYRDIYLDQTRLGKTMPVAGEILAANPSGMNPVPYVYSGWASGAGHVEQTGRFPLPSGYPPTVMYATGMASWCSITGQYRSTTDFP